MMRRREFVHVSASAAGVSVTGACCLESSGTIFAAAAGDCR